MNAEDIEPIKRMQRQNNISLQLVVTRKRFLETTARLCLTSDEAFRMTRSNDALHMTKRGKRERREAEKAEREAALYDKIRKMRVAHEKEALEYRVRQHGVREVLPRPMKEHRMLAKRIVDGKKV